MKFISLSTSAALALCVFGVQCVDSSCTNVREYAIETPDLTEFEIAIEDKDASEEPAPESNLEDRRTWGQWLRGLIWEAEQAETFAITGANNEQSQDDHCCGGDPDGYFDENTDASPEFPAEKKRNVKKIVVVTAVSIVVLLALVVLVLYFTKRGESADPNRPLVAA